MADFYPAAQQLQYPDMLAAYVRGQMAPLQVQGAQQQVTAGQLDIDKLRQIMRYAGEIHDQGARSAGGPTGGIQNGPQGQVSNQAPSASGSFDGSVGPPVNTMMALDVLQGRDPLKSAQFAQEYQLKQAQLQAQGPLNLAESVISSPNAHRIVMNNPSLLQGWRQYAPKLGLDPSDPTQLTPENARAAATLYYNDVAGRAGLPGKAMPAAPVLNIGLGQGEVAQIDPMTGKKVGDLTDRQTPTYTLVDRWDPATNTTVKVPVQIGGYGMGGVNPVSGATTSANRPGADGAPSGFNTGYKPPTDPELKAAMFGSEMRAGLQTMNRLEQGGFNLSPKARTLAINMATDERPGMLSQLFSQEIARHGLTADEQTYLSSMMPMLQAAGHDQSGARLTTAQIRQNVESLLPMDTKNQENMQQVRQNRQGFYNGLLTQAGSAAQLPQYRNTLGADLREAQTAGTPPQVGEIRKGHRFKGGDPSKQANWEKT